MLFIALSALQGRPMAAAFDELAALGAGVQLTPGNHPTPGFRACVAASGIATRRHHGFAFDARKTEVWRNGACVCDSESVHPPLCTPDSGSPWRSWYEQASVRPILEVMYPSYELGTGSEVEGAMDDGLSLAVDISHIYIQRTQGAMTERTWRRLQDYPGIAEVHVSANQGRHDTHQPICADSFGLDWAHAQWAAGTPVVYESYLHKLSRSERQAQLALVTR